MAPTTPQVEDWKQIRKRNLRMMRRQVRNIILLMALMEAMRVGPVEIVYAGRHGYPAPAQEDFGIAYTVGYVLSWLYVCAFMIVFVPLFSWWIPNTSSDSKTSSIAEKLLEILKKINMVLLPVSIAVSLLWHICYTVQTFIYVESRPVGSHAWPKHTRRNWLVRFFMLLGIAISISCGYGALQILANLDLAHVKPLEYAVIVIPAQVNFGVFLGSIMQFKMEKRIARKETMKLQNAKADGVAADEKAALLAV
ncbi:uncharacterized protein Z518_08630 [Rhinocladiella mackenziei CBS 650.93]|uniref:Rhinocladiella mackenziei CBS 650.93 unplaced genomic scaffold supercont1.6, whole genome shotgun sequence n=1 Tax=Rhinocladiella mackenziei CBS 650.93 TaxID=1442369 RepID=A0A0D2GWT6_9EURO|nr:uncharacterized protein Z518_08630 [Rhinocladiella mackenziei CBS 650.93]KIX02688.1 hypothetical protein Z518_08630 [Rhinocladiella mackenziei CBS 650.93]